MKGLFADCGHALRLYRRTPGSSLIAVLVLAVATAFVGAFLSLYVDLVLRPNPGFEQSSRIATIGQSNGPLFTGIPHEIVSRLSDEMASVEAAAIFSPSTTLVGTEREGATTAMVSEQFFSGLRPRIEVGRGFQADDHAANSEPVAVLSYSYWQRRFNGESGVLGSFLEISRDPSRPYRGVNFVSSAEPEEETARFRIVGVTARTVTIRPDVELDIWVPLERVHSMFLGVPEILPRQSGLTYVRLAPGASAAVIENEFRARFDSGESFPGRIPGTRLEAIEGIVSNATVQREAKRQLEVFLAGSVLLALVAAANVSLFLLARAPARRRELGVRLAVGAPFRRLARQLATEAGLLVVVSAVLGLIGSVWLSLYLRGLSLLRDAEWRDVTLLDWRVVSLAGLLLLLLTLLVSLSPILGIRRLGIAASSREVTGRASLAQRLAGTAQIAVAGMLGGAAIGFGWYLGVLMFGDPGYETANRYMVERVADARPGMADGYPVELDRRRDVIEAIPGVRAVAYGSVLPGAEETRGIFSLPAAIPHPADPDSEVEVYRGSFDHRFIDIIGLNLLYGRVPEAGEAFAVAVNQALARAFWGRDDVVGERLPGALFQGNEGAEVVGVLEDLSFAHPAAAPQPFVFTTLDSPGGLPMAIVETELTATGLKQALDRLAADGALEAEVGNVHPLAAIRNDLIAADRARAVLTIVTAILVVFLAAMGFYGTQRFLVAAGRREYAIRASLGAGPRALGQLVIRRGVTMSLPGLAAGGLLAFIVVAYLRDDFLSRDVAPAVVSLWVLAGLLVLLVAGSLGPAREARRTRPAPLLRED